MITFLNTDPSFSSTQVSPLLICPSCFFVVSLLRTSCLLKSGWSNFCTLVGHFSKLFEFAGLSWLKTPIFVPKSGCSLKKKKKTGIGLQLKSIYKVPFSSQNHSVLQKKVAAACTKLFRGPIVGPR